MVVLNPCKKCIIQPICRTRCKGRVDYTESFVVYLNVSALLIILCGFGLLILHFYHHLDNNDPIFFATVITLDVVTVFYVISNFMLRRLRNMIV